MFLAYLEVPKDLTKRRCFTKRTKIPKIPPKRRLSKIQRTNIHPQKKTLKHTKKTTHWRSYNPAGFCFLLFCFFLLCTKKNEKYQKYQCHQASSGKTVYKISSIIGHMILLCLQFQWNPTKNCAENCFCMEALVILSFWWQVFYWDCRICLSFSILGTVFCSETFDIEIKKFRLCKPGRIHVNKIKFLNVHDTSLVYEVLEKATQWWKKMLHQ